MQKLMEKIRFWVIFLALGCVVMTATNLLLYMHIAVCHVHHTHHHAHNSDDKVPVHDHHDNCLTCQILLGPGGKFISIAPELIEHVYKKELFTCTIDLEFIYQYQLGFLAARGPPCA